MSISICLRTAGVALLFALPLGARAAQLLLYDDTRGNMPQDQGAMAYFYDFFSGSDPGPQAVAGGVQLDTTGDRGDSAGFFSHIPGFWVPVSSSFPELDPADGFTLSFELDLHAEDHGTNINRAGFSALIVGEDLFGIELGFWTSEIWSQTLVGDQFRRGDGIAYDTTIGTILYDLTISGGDFFLFADGVEIFTGATRDYSAGSAFPDPYEVPSNLFLGDDTGSAGADFTLGRITLTTGPFAAAPAPLPVWLILPGLGWIVQRRPRL
jgi:hypothetical protein